MKLSSTIINKASKKERPSEQQDFHSRLKSLRLRVSKKNNGKQLTISYQGQDIDFWPSSESFYHRQKSEKGSGFHNLLESIGIDEKQRIEEISKRKRSKPQKTQFQKRLEKSDIESLTPKQIEKLRKEDRLCEECECRIASIGVTGLEYGEVYHKSWCSPCYTLSYKMK